jgi:hypothetical protein
MFSYVRKLQSNIQLCPLKQCSAMSTDFKAMFSYVHKDNVQLCPQTSKQCSAMSTKAMFSNVHKRHSPATQSCLADEDISCILWKYNPNYSLPLLPRPVESTTCTPSYCNVSYCVHLLPQGFFALRIPNKFCNHYRFLSSTTILMVTCVTYCMGQVRKIWSGKPYHHPLLVQF